MRHEFITFGDTTKIERRVIEAPMKKRSETLEFLWKHEYNVKVGGPKPLSDGSVDIDIYRAIIEREV